MPTVAIIGTGLIGCSWAAVFARAGWQVNCWDPDAGARAAAAARVTTCLSDFERHGLLGAAQQGDAPEAADAGRAPDARDDGAALDAATGRIRIRDTLEDAVAAVDFVQENGPEVLEIKLDTFARLDRASPPTAILASSTSAIVASRFTEALAGRGRCLVGHPVNPPHLVPVVEVCGAPWTDPGALTRARDVYAGIGQAPIRVVREVDGFILNRLQGALLAEAFRLVAEGYCSPQDLDTCLTEGLGRRWSFLGPFGTIELNAPGGMPDYCARYTGFYRRLQESPAPASVWDQQTWQRVVDAWGGAPAAGDVAAKSRWRDDRLAALAAHLDRQSSWREGR